MAVDTAHQVISHIAADFTDRKDNPCLPTIIDKLKPRLHKQGILWHNILADTAYSSGENYALLEKQAIDSFIPPHGLPRTLVGGTYKGAGWIYLHSRRKLLPMSK